MYLYTTPVGISIYEYIYYFHLPHMHLSPIMAIKELREAESKLADAHVNFSDHRRLSHLSATDLLTAMGQSDRLMV